MGDLEYTVFNSMDSISRGVFRLTYKNSEKLSSGNVTEDTK